MTPYQQALAKIITNSVDPDDISYKGLIDLITQDELDNAHDKSQDVIKCLSLKNIDSIRPAPKKISRIKVKTPYYQPDFKINSDFIALRIKVDPNQIIDYISKLSENVKRRDGYCYYRYDSDDIVAMIYIYMPSIGYIVELQVGSPFCFHVFRNDTKLRDIRSGLLEAPVKQPVDFWDNDFYSTIKSKILNDNNYDWKSDVFNLTANQL